MGYDTDGIWHGASDEDAHFCAACSTAVADWDTRCWDCGLLCGEAAGLAFDGINTLMEWRAEPAPFAAAYAEVRQ